MNGLLKTLIKPDWDDNPKRSEILHAANYVAIKEPAGFYPPYIEKRIVYPELYEKNN